jgi:ParB family chromosome partitioning protein
VWPGLLVVQFLVFSFSDFLKSREILVVRKYVRKPASFARLGPNARTNLGEESKARALARSRAKWQINPLIARMDGLLIDGYRTIWGLGLEGMLDVELDFILTDEDLTPDQIRVMQVNSAIHREPLSEFAKALGMRDTLASNAGMTKKQLAEDVFDIDPSLVTRYLSLFDCVPEVLEAAKAGTLGVSEWYAIHKSSDQLATLRLKLDGATRDELERQKVRKDREAGKPTVRASKVKINLAGGVAVTISGEKISLEDAIESMTTAVKQAKRARDQSLDIRTFAAVMRDRARAN